MGNPPIIEDKPGTPRTGENWKNGNLRFDLSDDAALAATMDEDAILRQRTQRRLAMARLAQRKDYK